MHDWFVQRLISDGIAIMQLMTSEHLLCTQTEATVIIADSIDYGTFEDSYGEIGLHMAKVEA